VESILLRRSNYTSEKAASCCGYAVHLLPTTCGQTSYQVTTNAENHRNLLYFMHFKYLHGIHAAAVAFAYSA